MGRAGRLAAGQTRVSDRRVKDPTEASDPQSANVDDPATEVEVSQPRSKQEVMPALAVGVVVAADPPDLNARLDDWRHFLVEWHFEVIEIGRASCRERVCQYV